jgi:invasion protein IalB
MTDSMRSTVLVSASTRAGVAVAAAFLSVAIISDGTATAAEPWPSAKAEIQQLVYSPWVKVCSSTNGIPGAKGMCRTGMDGRTKAGRRVVAADLIDPAGASKKLFRITLPSWLQSRFGTRLIIDDGQPMSGAFSTCSINGCVADYEATPELISKLKKGRILQIEAIIYSEAATAFMLPLADSSGSSLAGASEGPPTDPKVFAEQQRAASWLRFGCAAPPGYFLSCPRDDRKCEVASKMRGCVRDDLWKKP